MEEIKITNVEIKPESLESALKTLDEAIQKQTEMKHLIEQLLSLQRGERSARSYPYHPPPGRRGRRPGGGKTLREAIVEVLKKTKGSLKPVELRDKVLDSGYQTTATSQSFYTAVFNTARNEPGVVKTDAGFKWKGGNERSRKKKKKGRRSGPKKTSRKS